MTTDAATVLRPYRDQLAVLDEQLVELLAQRFAVCREVAETKRATGIPMMQPDRVEHVKQAYVARGRRLGLDPAFLRTLAALIIDEACRLEDDVIAGSRPRDGEGADR
ncbi:MAG TPA: chorismate mutase [Micromonosporaceae bacterium]